MFSLQSLGKLVISGGALLMVVGCGGPSRSDRALAAKDSRIRELQAQESEWASQSQAAQERERRAQAERDRIAEENAKIAAQAEKLARDYQSSVAEQEALRAKLAALEKDLGAQKDSDLQVVSSDKLGTITIRVANSVLFDPGQASLKSSAHGTLDRVAATLKSKYADHSIRVEGHTDSTPIVHNKHLYKDNMELSQARSKAVYDYMIRNAKMPANRMYTAGYSYFQPLAWPEKTAADRAKNRRVDIVILPNIQVKKESLASK